MEEKPFQLHKLCELAFYEVDEKEAKSSTNIMRGISILFFPFKNQSNKN